LQAHPGSALVETFETDPRPVVFIGVPDDENVTSLRGFLDQQTSVWNASGTCDRQEPLEAGQVLVRERWSGCRGGTETFLQQVWRIEGRPVYALARLRDGFGEATAEKMFESLELLAPSG
jgi:hypothetical protein